MSANKQKAIRKALRYVKRGNLDEAIKAYFGALSVDDRDYRVILRLGDLYWQKRDAAKALEFYREAAAKLSREGFFEHAISVYRQILQIEGPSPESVLSPAGFIGRF